MDATDINILAALQADGRMTNRDLGEHVGLSEAACSRRVSGSCDQEPFGVSPRKSIP